MLGYLSLYDALHDVLPFHIVILRDSAMQGDVEMIIYNFDAGCIWLRIFGKGILIIDRSIHPPLFSVRTGRKKEFRIGKYGIQLIR